MRTTVFLSLRSEDVSCFPDRYRWGWPIDAVRAASLCLRASSPSENHFCLSLGVVDQKSGLDILFWLLSVLLYSTGDIRFNFGSIIFRNLFWHINGTRIFLRYSKISSMYEICRVSCCSYNETLLLFYSISFASMLQTLFMILRSYNKNLRSFIREFNQQKSLKTTNFIEKPWDQFSLEAFLRQSKASTYCRNAILLRYNYL